MSQCWNHRIAMLPVLLLVALPALAHEGWILTPAEMLEWNSKPKPALFTQWSATNVLILGGALLFAMGWVRLGFTGARELFPDLQARLTAYGDYSAVILRFSLAWTLLVSAFAMEPRLGNALFDSPVLLAPDLELRFLGPEWMWLGKVEILLGLMFLFGLYVRLAAAILMVVSIFGLYLFGRDMITYLTAVWGVSLYLLLQGPGSRFVPLPIPRLMRPLVDLLAAVPRQRAQFLLRILVGLNFLYLGVYFKVLQPNLALGIIETYQVPILSSAPEFFVLMMAVVETFAGIFLFLGILMRPMAIFLLCAFIFFASFLEESFTAHMMFYGAMLTFLFNGAGHWRKPEAQDRPAHIVILGGGFSAIRAAMKLERLRGPYTHVRVTLVSPRGEFLFGPMLPEVVGGSVQPANVINPIRRILPATRVIEGRAERLDVASGELFIRRIDGAETTLSFTQLVQAESSEPDFNGIAGLAQHGLPIDRIGDALYLRQAVLARLTQAEHLAPGVERSSLLSFCVLGEGERASGTALAIRRLLHAAETAYPGVEPGEIRVILFEHADQSSRGRLGAARDRLLTRHGVERRDIAHIDAVTANAIYLTDQRRLPCATVVNARYQLPGSLVQPGARKWQQSNVQLGLAGQRNIWLAGDNSSVLRGQRLGHHDLYRLGEQAAYNAWAASQGFPLFDYRPAQRWLHALQMGRDSVAKLGPLVFGGLPAWFLSRISCLSGLPGLERNVRTVIDWFLDIPFRNDIAVLTTERTERLSQAYFHAGDVLLREGEPGDIAYVVQSGSVSVFVAGEKVHQSGRGDILGELALINNAPRTATAVCDTDVVVTCLSRDQFMELVTGLSVFGESIRTRTQLYRDQPSLNDALL